MTTPEYGSFMAQGGSLDSSNRVQLNLDLHSIGARVSPRPPLVIHARTENESTQVECLDLRARATFRTEFLGETRAAGIRVSSHGTSVSAEVPTSYRLITFVTHRLRTHESPALTVRWDRIQKRSLQRPAHVPTERRK